MKFVSFKHEKKISKKCTDASQEPIVSDIYLVAAVGAKIEVYKLVPTIEKIIDKTTSKCELKASTSLQLFKRLELPPNLDTVNDTKTDAKAKNRFPNEINTLAVSKHDSNEVYLCVGTSSGAILIWNLMEASTEPKHVVKNAHKKDVQEIQVNIALESQDHFVSIGTDSKAYVWSVFNCEKLHELLAPKMAKLGLRMRHARFTKSSTPALYTSFTPISPNPRKLLSYVFKWNAIDYHLERQAAVPNTMITALQTSKDGRVVCYGDNDGQIVLLDENLAQVARFRKQHLNVVTDLAFYHDSNESYDSNKLILSLSIDRTLQCYKYLNVRSYDSFKYFLIVFIFILLFCYFFTYME